MTQPVLEFNDVYFSYPRTRRYVIHGLNMKIERGELVAIMGENGAGKSTVCRMINGILPNSMGGFLKGQILVEGVETRGTPLVELATKVGVVLDDPETQLFTTSVLSEVAFGAENLCVPVEEIRERIKWALNIVRLSGYEDRLPTALSGGQKQRLAIAAALAMRPDILVLDEATSQLDPMGVVEVMSVICELKEKYGMTIVMATDHGEEVARVADRVAVLHHGRQIACGTPREIFENQDLLSQIMIRTPQVSQLGANLKKEGCPLPVFPITLDEARSGIQTLLAERKNGVHASQPQDETAAVEESLTGAQVPAEPIIRVEHLGYTYQPQEVQAVRDVSFDIQPGEFVALIGQNGSGKTTILKNLLGLLKPTKGKVCIAGLDTQKASVADLARHVGFVLQNPDQQLFAETVEEEIAYGPKNLGLDEASVKARVEEAIQTIGIQDIRTSFPPALPKGDRAKVVIASALALNPEVIILDEPTTGQDYKGCHQIMQIARSLHESGRTVVFVTHHMALVTEYARRVIVLCQGKILMDGPTEAVFSRPEILRQACVIPPQITELSQAIPASYGLPANALTVDRLARPILQKLCGTLVSQ